MERYWAIEEYVSVSARDLYEIVRRAGVRRPFRIVVRRSEDQGIWVDTDLVAYPELRAEIGGHFDDAVRHVIAMEPAEPWPRGRAILEFNLDRGVESLKDGDEIDAGTLAELAGAHLEEQGYVSSLGRKRVDWNRADLEDRVGQTLEASDLEVERLLIRQI